MSQDWLFDLGNTRLKCAVLGSDDRPGAVHAIAHDAHWRDALPQGRTAFVASVASGELRVELLDALTHRFRRISLARTAPAFAGLRIAYAQPDKLGVDRFLAMLGAREHAPGRAALVVGVGTALTIDLVDASGRHRGGRIAPSPTLMRTALHARAAHLPEHGGAYVEFAEDTEDALASGCEGAAIALVERSMAQAARLLEAKPRVFLHGGGAEALCVRIAEATHAPGLVVQEDLVLQGLARWALAERDPGPD